MEYASHIMGVDWAIGSMEIILDNAKAKNPESDFTEAEKKIEIFKSFRNSFNIVNAENFIIDKKIREEFSSNQSLKILIEKQFLEIKELKQKLKDNGYYR